MWTFDFIESEKKERDVYQANIWSEVERFNGWQLVGHFRADKSCCHEHDEERNDSHNDDSHNNDSHNNDDEIVPGKKTISVGPENGCMVPVAVAHVGFISHIWPNKC